MKIETLDQFYDTMKKSRKIRKEMVSRYLKNDDYNFKKDVQQLKNIKNDLLNIPKQKNSYILKLDELQNIEVDLSYEINELTKDITFLENGEMALQEQMKSMHPNFELEVEKGLRFLKEKQINGFYTDRDGTINNYCGRYKSSIQSVYNAVYLSRFAKKCAKNSVILTSAPIENPGLIDVSVTPDELFIYAASKGREYVVNGKKNQLPIEPQKQQKIAELNEKLVHLVEKPEYHKFTLIGSGIQFKFGQTTIARQDVNGSVPDDESKQFLQTVTNLVNQMDPEKKWFRIEDTGKDIEIILTIDSESGASKDFDKGDGIIYLNNELKLQLQKGINLVCGDTHSDVAMVEKIKDQQGTQIVIFVTTDEKLKKEITGIIPENETLFVSTPDVLVEILNQHAKNY